MYLPSSKDRLAGAPPRHSREAWNGRTDRSTLHSPCCCRLSRGATVASSRESSASARALQPALRGRLKHSACCGEPGRCVQPPGRERPHARSPLTSPGALRGSPILALNLPQHSSATARRRRRARQQPGDEADAERVHDNEHDDQRAKAVQVVRTVVHQVHPLLHHMVAPLQCPEQVGTSTTMCVPWRSGMAAGAAAELLHTGN